MTQSFDRTGQSLPLTRRQAIHRAAGLTSLAALSRLHDADALESATAAPLRPPMGDLNLRIATCQFPVSGNAAENGNYIRQFIDQAADAGANLLHTSEACLSGYAGIDFASFDGYDWGRLRRETRALRERAKERKLWLVLGSAHFLDDRTKPTNCLYLIDAEGGIADRYDKCFCTGGDQKHYSVGDRLVVRDIRGVRIGLAICYDICWPQFYMANRDLGATVMIHSFHNARSKGPNCLDVLNVHQVPTRCADNRMWAVCNNSAQPYSHWGSFIARPDATIAKQLEINKPGMLIHDFPDGLSEGGWYHNFQPLRKRDDEIMSWGKPIPHARRANGQAEP